MHLTAPAILATVTDMYTRAIADLERRRGLREISDEQYLDAKGKIEVERYKAESRCGYSRELGGSTGHRVVALTPS
jgi:hypothetical protein